MRAPGKAPGASPRDGEQPTKGSACHAQAEGLCTALPEGGEALSHDDSAPGPRPGTAARASAARTRCYAAVMAADSVGAGAIAPVFSLMLLGRGLSYAQLAQALAVYTGVSLALEVPSGIVADLLGRRGTYLAAKLLTAAAVALFLLTPEGGFAPALCAMALYGAGRAMNSGSFEALWIDAHLAEGGALRRVVTLQSICETGGLALGALLGGVLYALDAGCGLNLGARLAGTLAAGLLAMAWVREPARAERGTRPTLRKQAAALRQAASGTPILPVLLCGTAFVGAVMVLVEAYWQPRFLAAAGEGAAALTGVLGSGTFCGAMLGSVLASAFLGRAASHRARLGIYVGGRLAVCAAVCLLSVQGGLWSFAAVFLLFYLTLGAATTVESVLLGDVTPPQVRATVLSVQGLLLSLGCLVAFSAAGAAAQAASVPGFWRGAGLALAGAAAAAALLLRRAAKREEST